MLQNNIQFCFNESFSKSHFAPQKLTMVSFLDWRWKIRLQRNQWRTKDENRTQNALDKVHVFNSKEAQPKPLQFTRTFHFYFKKIEKVLNNFCTDNLCVVRLVVKITVSSYVRNKCSLQNEKHIIQKKTSKELTHR